MQSPKTHIHTHNPSCSFNLEIDTSIAAYARSFQEIGKLYSKTVWSSFKMLFLSNCLDPYYLLSHLYNCFKERNKNDQQSSSLHLYSQSTMEGEGSGYPDLNSNRMHFNPLLFFFLWLRYCVQDKTNSGILKILVLALKPKLSKRSERVCLCCFLGV